MLLVVFGAGASYDSAPSYPVPKGSISILNEQAIQVEQNRPPLADELFENRGVFAQVLTQFPRCHALVPHLRHLAPTLNLERVLAGYLVKAKGYPELHSQIMAVRYYLALVIKTCEQQWQGVHLGITNYRSLLGEIERWRHEKHESVCFVTFNYDTMLEIACADVGLRFDVFPDYISNGNYKLCKLHGSVNWGRYTALELKELTNPQQWLVADEVIKRADSLHVDGPWTFVQTQPPTMNLSSDELAIVPAIAIPIDKKGAFECPKQHIDALKQCLPNVTKMVTIGWRATEDHFLKLLGEGLAKTTSLMVIAGTQREAMEIGRKLLPERLDINAATGGFTDSILSRAIETFLWS